MRYWLICSICCLAACVPQSKYAELEKKQKLCDEELRSLKQKHIDLETQHNEMKTQFAEALDNYNKMKQDTSILGKQYRQKMNDCERISESYEKLLAANKQLSEGSANASANLSKFLQETQDQLIKKEDELRLLEIELDNKKRLLDELSTDLAIREKKVKELEEIIAKKDKAVDDLKARVSAALTGLENNGLTVVKKNGKVYISMDEKLLFASGSTTVGAKGEDALKKIAKLLETNTEVNIVVEGHTDNVPLAGTGAIKDNWDLSVMRAGTVVKIILANGKIDPKRLTASGRGEFLPVAENNSAENKAKNRRTDLILSPKLDELFEILEVK